MAQPPWPRLLVSLPTVLRRLLTPNAGALLAPVRSEIFGPQRFAQHGRSLGLTHEARRPGWAGAIFFPRLRGNIRMLRQAHQALLAQGGTGDDTSPATQWLLDNFHLIDAQLLAIHEGLPRSYFRALPVLQTEPLAGLPRIYGVAWAFVAHTDSAFDDELLVQLLCAYQESRELQLSEMWALPTTLRVVLVENLRRLAERLATGKAARELANRCCDRIGRGQTPDLSEILELATRRGVDAVFLAQMGLRLQDHASGASQRVPPEVLAWLNGVLPNLAAVQAQQSAEQTADNLSVSNAVSSLRAIGDADWPQIVSRASPLMRRMLGSALFAAEHHGTQDDTLHGIERLARRSGHSEMEVAQALLLLMAPQAGSGSAAEAAGHWLHGAGRPTLCRALGLRARWPADWRRSWHSAVLPLYLAALALGTAAVVSGVSRLAPDAHAQAAWLALALMAWPASEAVIALLHRIVAESTRPRRLPRLALAEGIPPEHRVLVVIPAMLGDAAAIDAAGAPPRTAPPGQPGDRGAVRAAHRLVRRRQRRRPGDDALLAQATRQVDELNTRHAAEGERRAFCCCTGAGATATASSAGSAGSASAASSNNWSPCWPAWATCPPRRPSSTSVRCPRRTPAHATWSRSTATRSCRQGGCASWSAWRRIRPTGRCSSADGRRVVAGYGILQPRLVTPLPLPQRRHLLPLACSPASAASTRTARPAPRSTRTCSTKAASPARGC